jgi:hypothetical protein
MECPGPQIFADGLELVTVKARRISVNHLALVIDQQAHANHSVGLPTARWRDDLWWFHLTGKIPFSLLR